MGLFTDGALVIAPGKKKVNALGASVMRDVAESVETDVFMRRDGLKADGALAIEGAMMAAWLGRVNIIEPSVSPVRRVELSSNGVSKTIRVSFVGTKIQSN